jgi:dihydrodipicolinate synthase
MKDLLFTGSAVAIVTPFNEDLSINYLELEKLIEFQIENKTDAIIACGTTGESATMTEDEHLDVIKFIIDKVNKRVPVIAGTGSNDTRVCLSMSLEAKTLGADALLLVTPYYNKTSQNGLVSHFNYIADNVQLPCILYNVPGRTALNILPETYLELSKNPYIIATKDASGDLSSLAKTIALCGDNLAVYSGEDTLTLPIMAMGGKGVISAFANVFPAQMVELTHAVLRNDYDTARKLSNEFNDIMGPDGFFIDVSPVPIKETMNLMGFTCGPCRMPLCNMTEDKQEKLRTVLKKHSII